MRVVRQGVSVVVLTLALVAGFGASADAAVIGYRHTDLVDVAPGEDLWMSEFFVSDVTFGVDQGFSIYFSSSLYEDLDSPAAGPSAGWDVLTIQPDTVLPSDGFVDALALVNAPSLALPFVATFNWLGGPSLLPGGQLFTINQFDEFGNITFLESGATSAYQAPSSSVPEPSSLLLLGSGLAFAVQRCRRRRTRGTQASRTC